MEGQFNLSINTWRNSGRSPVKLPVIIIKVSNFEIRALLDTGASCSLLEETVFEKIKTDENIKNLAANVSIKTVVGGNIEFTGCKKIPVSFGNKTMMHPFFITKQTLTDDYNCILGYDFIIQNKLKIDLNKNEVQLNDSTVKISDEVTEESLNNINIDKYGIIPKKTLVPAGETMKLEIKIKDYIPVGTELLVEPLDNKNNVLVYNAFCRVSENKTVDIIVANLSTSDVTLNKNTKLVKLDTQVEIQEQNFERQQARINKRQEEISADDFNLSHLPIHQRERLLKLLLSYSDIFSKSMETIGESDLIQPRIELMHEEPVRVRPFKTPQALKPILKEQLDQLLKAGIIREADSNYAFPLIMVKKKRLNPNEEQTYRLCVDFRLLNEITYPSTYQLPKIEDILHSLAGSKYYSTFDLHSSFYQLRLHEDDIKYATFTCDFGEFSYTRFPMGLSNSAPFFQKLADKLLQGLKEMKIFGYLDDLICASDSFEDTLEKLKVLFDRFRKHGLTLSPKKCQFLKENINYLGHVISKIGIQPADTNISNINNFPVPNTMRRLRRFVGMANFFRKFIKGFSELIAPLTDLTKKSNSSFKWNEEADKAFKMVKEKLLSKPLLIHPDFNKTFYLFCDASKIGISGVMMQKDDSDYLQPVAYYSRKLNQNESKWPIMQLECFAIVESIKHFKNYLYGRNFVVLSDNEPLQNFIKLDHPGGRLARWMLFLSEYDFEFRHIKGKYNVVADIFSRDIHDVNVNIAYSIPTTEEIILEQRNDPNLKKIIDILENQISTSKKINEAYFIEDKLLKYVTFSKSESEEENVIERIVIPEKFKPHILASCHAPHFGLQKTYEAVSKHYFWVNMYSETKHYVMSCIDCLERKGFRKKHAPLVRRETPSNTNSAISLDFIGPLKTSERGNKYILVIICQFSRFVQVYPLKDMTAESTCEKLLEYICNFGIPEVILSDQGKNFESKLCKELCDRLHINKIRTSPYHPETNGINERSHFMLKNTIACMANDTKNWEENLQFYQFSYNNTTHSATKYKPSYLMFGQNLKMPFEVNHDEEKFDSYDSFVDRKLNKLKKAYLEVKENLEESAEKQETYHNRKAVEKQFNDGDLVMLYTPRIETSLGKTFTRQYKGPFRVIKKTSPVNYVIREIKNPQAKSMLVHVDRLFPYTERDPKFVLPQEEKEKERYLHLPQYDTDSEDDIQIFPTPVNRDRRIRVGRDSTDTIVYDVEKEIQESGLREKENAVVTEKIRFNPRYELRPLKSSNVNNIYIKDKDPFIHMIPTVENPEQGELLDNFGDLAQKLKRKNQMLLRETNEFEIDSYVETLV